jgi:hypothetical protein
MEAILTCISDEPVAFTYLGIGSCPHVAEGGTLAIKHDQLIPLCLRNTKSMRILHFDPYFDRYKEFLNHYFQSWNLVPVDFEGGYRWIGDDKDVIVIPERVEHEGHAWFFESLCAKILDTPGKLLLQEYTGYEVTDLTTKLYNISTQKEKFKRRILLDMTFGTDTGCCTDMVKAKLFYDSSGNFLNLHFATDTDAKRWTGLSRDLDEILQQKYKMKFLQTLNHVHVDYRRRLKGEPSLYGCPHYTDTSTPDEIMKVLQQSLIPIFDLLLTLHVVESKNHELFKDLLQNYTRYDPYKWYDAVLKLLGRP